MDRKDPRGYYKVLNIASDAAPEEVRLSYEFLKQAWREHRAGLHIGLIQEAYDTLSDPQRRQAYDGGSQAAKSATAAVRRGRSRRPGSVGLLAALALSLTAALGVMNRTALRAALVEYEAGDVLYTIADGQRVGVVRRLERAHRFFNGAVGDAYLLEETDGGEPVWYPARDLERNCRR